MICKIFCKKLLMKVKHFNLFSEEQNYLPNPMTILNYVIHFCLKKDNGEEINQIYWKCEQKCQKLTNQITSYIFCEYVVYIVTFSVSVYNILSGNFVTSTWLTTYNLVLPFNTRCIWKWYLQFFIHFNMGMSYSSCNIPTTSFFVSCCMYIGAISDHFVLSIRSFNKKIKKMQETNNSRSYRKLYIIVEEKLRKSIEIHNKLYE